MKTILNDRRTKQLGRWLLGLIPVIAVGWIGLACEEQDLDRTFQGPYFVRFTDSTLTYKESYSQPISIRVHNVGPILSQPITVNYTVSGSAREGKDYTLPDTKGTVIIPANKSFGEIKLQLINNANNILESQSLTFTLTGVQPSSLQVGFGKDGIVGKTMTFVIQDECLFGGFYTGAQRVGTTNASVSNVEITSTNCKDYRLSNWNIGGYLFNFNAIKPTLTFTDNGDNSLTIPPQANAELGSTDTLRGNGSWNPRDRRITLNIQAKIRISNEPVRDTTIAFTQTYTPQ
ncbi:hypothetical protein ACFSUS_06050 [Spirosoma soli]|uniref:Calx-beta domain-containing protein n=1 Tax=Spirosoma soli TaxID=1770529 RepID=A0ABW5LZG4_9BACT